MNGFSAWLARILGNWHSIHDGEIVFGNPARPRDSVKLDEIVAWRVIGQMGFDVIEIELRSGAKKQWIDTHDDLIGCLRSGAGEKEVKESW